MASDIVRTIGGYCLGPKLGAGKFAKVRIARRKEETTYQYAVKYMKIGKPYDKATLTKLLKEETSITGLHHPNILQIYESNTNAIYEKRKIVVPENGVEPMVKEISVVYIVIQLARTGDLFDFLASFGPLSEKVARYYFLQMLNAIEYLHSSGYAHRDLKPENLLLDMNYNILLSDFGFCTKLCTTGPAAKLKDRVGTERYMSPELYSKQPYSPVYADLFASGVILFMFIACHPPFTCASPVDSEHYKLIKDQKVNDYWEAIKKLHPENWCSPQLMHLLMLMFQFEPSLRPSISEIRAHPWISGELPTQSELVAEFEQRQAKAIQARKDEAMQRKIQKSIKKKSEAIKRIQKGPHYVKRSSESEMEINPTAHLQKKHKDFGTYENQKPTLLFSAEDIETIEGTLIAFLEAGNNVIVSKNTYKVLLYI